MRLGPERWVGYSLRPWVPMAEWCEGDDDRERLRSYSRLDATCAEVIRPRSVAALAEALIAARDAGRRLTVRAGGMSLHDQSLNDDLVISLGHLNQIDAVDVERRQITVGASATWGDIVSATLKHDLVPYVVVTSKRCTSGGTLSSDGIARSSPAFGSESVYVASFDFLAVGKTETRTIERPRPDDADSDDARLFHAVIGGFGYLGVVTAVTYDLLSLSRVGGAEAAGLPLEVTTRLWAFSSFEELIAKQIALLPVPLEEAREHGRFPTRADGVDCPSVYAVMFPHEGDGRGAVFESTYSRGDRGEPYIIYRPHSWLRVVAGLLLTWTWLKPTIKWLTWRDMKRASDQGLVFVNGVLDYLFFMDSDVATKVFFERPPRRLMPVIQQTYVIHYDLAAQFLRALSAKLEERGIEPTLFESLFLPSGRALMSASHGTPSFAITLAFQDVAQAARRDAVIAVLEELAEICHRTFQGRVHFTKNVYASKEVLREMYADRTDSFLALKRRHDPEGLLRNDFFERVFPTATPVDGSAPG